MKAEAATAGAWDAAQTELKAEAGAVVSWEAAEMRWRLMQRLPQQYHARQER